VIVMNTLECLDLGGQFGAALRPVSLNNTIGLPPGTEPNDYWEPIYRATGLDAKMVPTVSTVVDEVKIQAYYNCEIFSVDPGLGIFRKWAEILSGLLKDEKYQQTACTTFLRRLFLHQAVLSAVITTKTPLPKIKPLPLACSYPFNQHAKLPAGQAAASLNELSAVIFDNAWSAIPDWMDKIPVSGELKTWLFDAYLDYLKLHDHLYRMEGSCNSYLITSAHGSVLIDPAGAAIAPAYFQHIIRSHPLQAILLTHAHNDHRDHIRLWKAQPNIPVIAQRGHVAFIQYQDRLAGFFARRNAIWAGHPMPGETVKAAGSTIEATVFFTDDHQFEMDGLHFIMTHTPGETPDHATIWVPELRAVFVGDNYYPYFINNATLRGTSPRPMLGYIGALDAALAYQPQYFLPGHDSPIIGWERIKTSVGDFRDALRTIHDATVEGMNQGKDVHTLMREITLPPRYPIPQYFGKVEWTVRGIYQEYAGWFDENPASMYAIPASSIHTDLVEAAAGGESLVQKANEYLQKNEYVKALHLTTVVLHADPDRPSALAARQQALAALKKNSRNYIERIWLDHGIRQVEERLKQAHR